MGFAKHSNRYHLGIVQSVTLWYDNKRRPTIMRFSPDSSPKTLVFGDFKLWKFEGYHPSKTTSGFIANWKDKIQRLFKDLKLQSSSTKSID